MLLEQLIVLNYEKKMCWMSEF